MAEIGDQKLSRRDLLFGCGLAASAAFLPAGLAGVYGVGKYLEMLGEKALEPDFNYLNRMDLETPQSLCPDRLHLGQPSLPDKLRGVAGNFYNLWRWVDKDIELLAAIFRDGKGSPEELERLRASIQEKPLYRVLSGAKDLGFRRLRIYINDAEAFRHRVPLRLESEIKNGYWFLEGFQDSVNPNNKDRYNFTVLDKIDCLFYLSKILGFDFDFEIELSDAFNLIHAPLFFSSNPDNEPSLTSPFLNLTLGVSHAQKVANFFTDNFAIDRFKKRITVISQHRGKYTGELFASQPQIVAVSPMNEPNPFAIDTGVTRKQARDWFTTIAKHTKNLFGDKILIFGYGQQGNINQCIEDLGSIEEIDVFPFHFYFKAVNPLLFRSLAKSLRTPFERSRKPLYLQEVNFGFSEVSELPGFSHDQLTAIFLKQLFQALCQDGRLLTNSIGCWGLAIPDPDNPERFDENEELNKRDRHWIVPGMERTKDFLNFLDQLFIKIPVSC